MIVCCCSIPRPSIDNFFCSKRVILSLTLKERAIHVCLASLLRQYPSIDNLFRSKGVFTHLCFLFVLASSLACFFVYTLGEICGRFFLERGIAHFIRLFVYLCWRQVWAKFVVATSFACYLCSPLECFYAKVCSRSSSRTSNIHTLHSLVICVSLVICARRLSVCSRSCSRTSNIHTLHSLVICIQLAA